MTPPGGNSAVPPFGPGLPVGFPPQQMQQVQFQQTTFLPIPSGDDMQKWEPYIPNIGQRFWDKFNEETTHRMGMESQGMALQRENQRIQEKAIELQHEERIKALGNEASESQERWISIRRAQWIAGGLLLVGLAIIGVMIYAAYQLFMHDKIWPAAAFTAMAGAVGWGFRSIAGGYLKNEEEKRSSKKS